SVPAASMGNRPSSSTTNSSVNLVETGSTRVLRRPIFKIVKYVRTLVGILTVIALIIAGIDSVLSLPSIPVGIYLIVIVCPVFLLEVGYIIRTVCGTDGICCRTFSLVLSFDKISRGLFYLLLSIPCFLDILGPSTFTQIAGAFLIISGILYILKGREYKTVKTYVNNTSPVQPARDPA
ncbi:hypothetical protein PMAYCL1PPCAC_33082, partial [Pristionchus mayeri]